MALHFFPIPDDANDIFQNIVRKYPEYCQFSMYFEENFLKTQSLMGTAVDVSRSTYDLEKHVMNIGRYDTGDGLIGSYNFWVYTS